MIAVIVIGSFLSTVIPSSAQEVTITSDKTEYEPGEEINATLNYEGEIYQWGNSGWSIQNLKDGSWVTIQKRDDLYFRCANIPECKGVNLNKIEECPSVVLCERPTWYKVQEMPKDMLRFAWGQSYKIEEKTFQCNSIIYDSPNRNGKIISSKIEDRSCGVFDQVSPGKYKVRFEYTLSIDPNDKFNRNIDIKYAEKEFVIKEKRGISTSKNCNEYEMPMQEEEIKECACAEGYKKFPRLSGAYCASDSRRPCKAHLDCPQGERCISDDGKNWFCTGQFAGCFYRDPENPKEKYCAD